MAGLLPEVPLIRSRRMREHRLEEFFNYRQSYLKEQFESSTTAVKEMDETTIRARKRLEQKLGHFHSSFWPSNLKQNEGRGTGSANRAARTKETRLGSKLIGKKRWNFQFNRCNSNRKVCAVCLEDFQQEQQMTELSCSHKYHSNCVLPWLAAHPHCPYCRSPVPS